MQFTRHTLKSTFARFRKTLKEQHLELSLNAAQDVWAEIVLGKKYSAASASLNRHGHLNAKNISEESIRKQLKIRNREVDTKTAYGLFTAAVGEDLTDLSDAMHDIVHVLSLLEGSCVIPACGDASGLGILRTGQAGYIPVSTLPLSEKSLGNLAWLRANSDIAAEVINATAGVGSDQFAEIFFSNSRAGEKKSAQAFFQYFSARIDESARAVAESVLQTFAVGNEADWDIDFDVVRDEILEVFEELASKKEWVKPDCNFAEAMIDHLAARVRENLKWLRGLAAGGKHEYSAKDSLEQEVRLSMRKFLDAEATSQLMTPA